MRPGHFLTTARLRIAKLLQPWKGTAADGPVKLLDLERMRADAHQRFPSCAGTWRSSSGLLFGKR